MRALISKGLFIFVLVSAAMLACDDPEAPGVVPSSDGGMPDNGRSSDDDDDVVGSGDDDDDDDDDAVDGGGTLPPRPAPVFLDKGDYEALFSIDATFPFDVTQVHAATRDVLAARWGAHDGPLVTTSIYGNTGPSATVIRWKLPSDPRGAAIPMTLPLAKATNLPDEFFYGADGVVDLLFGPGALLSYSTSDSPFAGEALLYSADYSAVKSRAKVNGFYSGIGVRSGKVDAIVYSALSELRDDDLGGADNGLWVSPLCKEALVGPAPCVEGHQLFKWNGNSGPVVSDVAGNVFVGASLSSGDTSDVVYGITPKQAVAPDEVTPTTVAAVDSVGTATLAAIAPEGKGPGYVLGLGFAEGGSVYAAPYSVAGERLKTAGDVVPKAITPTKATDALYLFTDAEGDLWIAVLQGTKGSFVELRRK